jgi:A/G-specific adenine glycosylase
MKVPTSLEAHNVDLGRPLRFRGRSLEEFQDALLGWYRSGTRPLRIRDANGPWSVLVAEVMAQQTQISRVDAAWSGFIGRFPTPRRLSEASTADVLRAWAGLGYNRRAVNLQRAARDIETDHDGRVPSAIVELEALPGVGPYTSRAVAAMAYGLPVAAVDTNVRRVVARLLGRALEGRELQAAADALVARDDPAAWAHACMDLGATVCRPSRPDCGSCPVSRWCASAGRPETMVRTGVRRLDDAPAGGGSDTRARGGSAARAAAAFSAEVDPVLAVAAKSGEADSMRKADARGGAHARRDLPPSAGLPFEQTTRWLRGRIVARLRDGDPDAWQRLPKELGSHGFERVASAVAALEREGLLERHPDGSVRLPSKAM